MIAATLIAVTLIAVDVAEAAEERRTSTVGERSRPETEPVGVRWGGFIAFPSVTVTESYNDNIFAKNTATVDDLITEIEPALIIDSNWNRHSLRLYGNAQIGRYLDRTKENFEDFTIGAETRLDALRDTNISAAIVHSSLHEDRGSPDDSAGAEPGQYTVTTPSIGIANTWNRVSLAATGTLTVYDYDDVPTNTTTINNDDRDREKIELMVRGGYEIVPDYEGFVRLTYNDSDYVDNVDDNGFDRDSDGLEIVAGARIDLSGLAFGDIFVGYVEQSYDDASLKKLDGIAFGADLTWNITRITTLKLGISRAVVETTQSNASGSLLTDVDISADHELLRNLIISARAGFGMNDYEGISREDDTMNFAIEGKYLLNRNLYITLGYDFNQRDSNVTGQDYSTNVVMLRVKGQI